MSYVYLIQQNLIKKIENALKITGIENIDKRDRVVIKLNIGEYGNLNYVRPPVVGKIVDVIKKIGGKPFLFDTPTLYRGSRFTVGGYSKTAMSNGFTKETVGCPILISDRGVNIKIDKLLKSVDVAKYLHDADAIVVISHVKGHEMSGFGGAIKNLGMGGVTRKGKAMVHMRHFPDSLSDAAYAALKSFDNNKKFFVNVLLDISPKCDCLPLGSVDTGFPICGNIGILFSVDPVAIDIASIDLINKKTGKNVFYEIHNVEPKTHIEYASKLGMGNTKYQLKILE